MAFAVLVPTYNQVVFFRFFKDAPYIIEIFILFGDIAADKSMSRAVGFPHRAIKVVGPSLFIIIFRRFSGDDDFVVIQGEDFSKGKFAIIANLRTHLFPVSPGLSRQ